MPKDELPIPDTRSEAFLDNIATGSGDIDKIPIRSDMDKFLYYIAKNGASGGGSAPSEISWGSIKGTLSNQTDLKSAIDLASVTTWGDIEGTIDAQTDLQNEIDTASTTSIWGGISGTLASQTDLKSELDAKATVRTFNVTLVASGWSENAPFTQTISVNGMLETDSPITDIVLNDTTATAIAENKAFGYVSKITTANDSITVVCLEKQPEVDITIQLKVVR